MKKRYIVYLAIVVFTLLTIPSISAIESNTTLNLKKSLSYKSHEQIKEQIKDIFLPRVNDILRFIVKTLILNVISYNLIINNYKILGALVIFTNFIMLINFLNT